MHRKVKDKTAPSCFTQGCVQGGKKSSVQFSRLVVSDSLWPHGLQHASRSLLKLMSIANGMDEPVECCVCICVCGCVQSLSHVQLCDPMDCRPPGSSSRQEYWSALPCPTPGDLSDLGIEPIPLVSSALAGGFCPALKTLSSDQTLPHLFPVPHWY